MSVSVINVFPLNQDSLNLGLLVGSRGKGVEVEVEVEGTEWTETFLDLSHLTRTLAAQTVDALYFLWLTYRSARHPG